MLEFGADAVLAALAFALAFALRFVDNDFVLPDRYGTMLLGSVAFVAIGKALVLEILGQHRQWWRYFRLPDLWPLCRSLLIASGLMVLVFALIQPYDYGLPRSVIVLDLILSCVLLGGARLARRTIAERPDRAARQRRSRDVLVIGAGSGGQMVVRELQLNPKLGARAIGFLDDDPSKRSMRAAGVKVLGTTDQIDAVLDRLQPDEVVIAIPSAPGVLRGRVVAACRDREIPVRTLPTVFELLRGGVQLTRQLREVQVEDVLGREPVVMELDRVGAYLEDKRVLVTGAGGSIGSELVRQIARVRPRLLILLDHAEDNLFEIDREMTSRWHFTRVESVLADCKEGDRMLEVMKRFRPQVVFHAAAYKHVPLMEANPLEALRNNAIATPGDGGDRGSVRRRALRPRVHRQGRQPAHRDGGVEGDGRVDRRGGGAAPSADEVHRRPLRQRARLLGQRRPDLPLARSSSGGPVTVTASRDDPLLHDDPGGGPARDPARATSAVRAARSSCSRWASR